MVPNEVLSAQLKVKRLLKQDEKAVFMLTNAFKHENGREEKTVPEVYSFSKEKTVNDPYAEGGGRKVVIGNVVGSTSRELPDGRRIMIPKTAQLEFIRGFCVIGAEANESYQYAMRRPENESNQFRAVMATKASEKKILFKLVDDKKEISHALLLEDLKYAAQRLIRETSSVEGLKAIALKLNQSPDKRLHVKSYNPPIVEDIQGIKLDLIQKIPLFAKAIIYASTDQKAKLKVLIMEALNFGVLIMEEGSFQLLGDKPIILFTPEADKDKTDSLVDYFSDEKGKKHYAEFTAVLRKALKSGPE